MTLNNAASVLCYLSFLCFWPLSPLHAEPPPAVIRGVNFAGSGCSSEGSSFKLLPDGKRLSMHFNDFRVFNNEGKEACSVSVLIEPAAGTQLKLESVHHKGLVRIGEGASALLHAIYSFPTADIPGYTLSRAKRWRGSMNEAFKLQHKLDTPWSPCGQALTLEATSSLQVRGAYISQYRLSNPELSFNFDYRACATPR